MVEELAANLYRLEIPLPGNPLKSINSYVIKGAGRNLIVDTGMNRKVCMEVMQEGLKELAVDLSKTDFFITHLHADHFGLVADLATDSSKVYFNKPDADHILHTDGWNDMIKFAGLNGFPEEELQAALSNHPGYKYYAKTIPSLTLLDDGETINVGDYTFTCVQTPGHTRGHTCLYESGKKIFLSGDHILIDITPNIQLWSDGEDPLSQYIASLDRVSHLDIALMLPGHRRMIKDYTGRIRELKEHHQHRADEVLAILKEQARTAYQVASKMTWDIVCDSWDDFPLMQKWFATGEALAHLKYVEEKGQAFKEIRGGKTVYTVSK